MAEVSGGAAYQRLEKPDNAISQGLQYWGGIAAQQQEAEKARAAGRRAAADKAKADFYKKLELEDGDFQSKISGFQSDDDIKRDYAITSRDAYLELASQAKDLYDQGDFRGSDALAQKMNALRGNFKLVNAANEHLKGQFDEIVKAQAKGYISDVDSDKIGMMQAFAKNNVRIINDENGHPMLQYAIEGEDGSLQTKYMPYQEVVDTSTPYIAKQDLYGDKGFVNNLADKLGKVTEANSRGVKTYENQVWKDDLQGKAVNTELAAYLMDDDTMADVSSQLGLNPTKKRTDFTPEERAAAQKQLYDSVRSRYDEKTSLGLNMGLMNYNQRLREFNYRKARDTKDDNKLMFVKEEAGTGGTPYLNTLYGQGLNIDSEKSFAFSKPIEIKTKGTQPTTYYGVAVDQDGDVMLVGSEYVGNVRQADKASGTTVTVPQYKPKNLKLDGNEEEVLQIMAGTVDDKGNKFTSLDQVKRYLGKAPALATPVDEVEPEENDNRERIDY